MSPNSLVGVFKNSLSNPSIFQSQVFLLPHDVFVDPNPNYSFNPNLNHLVTHTPLIAGGVNYA